jgi:hypothetical protein
VHTQCGASAGWQHMLGDSRVSTHGKHSVSLPPAGLSTPPGASYVHMQPCCTTPAWEPGSRHSALYSITGSVMCRNPLDPSTGTDPTDCCECILADRLSRNLLTTSVRQGFCSRHHQDNPYLSSAVPFDSWRVFACSMLLSGCRCVRRPAACLELVRAANSTPDATSSGHEASRQPSSRGPARYLSRESCCREAHGSCFPL